MPAGSSSYGSAKKRASSAPGPYAGGPKKRAVSAGARASSKKSSKNWFAKRPVSGKMGGSKKKAPKRHTKALLDASLGWNRCLASMAGARGQHTPVNLTLKASVSTYTAYEAIMVIQYNTAGAALMYTASNLSSYILMNNDLRADPRVAMRPSRKTVSICNVSPLDRLEGWVNVVNIEEGFDLDYNSGDVNSLTQNCWDNLVNIALTHPKSQTFSLASLQQSKKWSLHFASGITAAEFTEWKGETGTTYTNASREAMKQDAKRAACSTLIFHFPSTSTVQNLSVRVNEQICARFDASSLLGTMMTQEATVPSNDFLAHVAKNSSFPHEGPGGFQ